VLSFWVLTAVYDHLVTKRGETSFISALRKQSQWIWVFTHREQNSQSHSNSRFELRLYVLFCCSFVFV